MKSNLTTFLKTVTGKAVVATGVVLLGFGGAAAAGLADVPSFTPAAERAAPQAQRDESTDATSDDSSDTSDDSSDTNDESSDESTDATTDASSGATSDDEATDDEATHGAIVSEFARTTELEGCEKGQAIAELASANAADHRQNPETDHDPCADETSADASSAEESSDAAPEESSDDGSSGDEPTHGQIVSEFARTTELEGCEKGQAISELASSNAADHRQNPETDHEPCARDDDGEESADDAADTGETPTEITADESGATNAGPPAEAPGRSGEHRNDGNNGNNGNGNSGSRGNGNGRGK